MSPQIKSRTRNTSLRKEHDNIECSKHKEDCTRYKDELLWYKEECTKYKEEVSWYK